ncbi:Serine protease [Mycena sanguinolenta]|uniref:Serine protease n=1 Tax=Mycena sanguinolenta TaxID=230812 RepID=A0A8H6YBK3_9AGAR|nr:Serine protease [Mycena sanguinolenta]
MLSPRARAATWTLDVPTTADPAPETETVTDANHGAESVLGQDFRELVAPTDFQDGGKYRSIVKIQSRFRNSNGDDVWMMGTGWLIRPDLLVTAGHVVYDRAYNCGAATQIKCYIGYNGAQSVPKRYGFADIPPVQPRYGSQVVTTESWIKDNDARPRDVAFIRVHKPFFGKLNLFSFTNTISPTMLRVGVVGYPGDKDLNGEKGAQMYELFDNTAIDVDKHPRHMISYHISTYGGQSGAPVLSKTNAGLIAIGTHCYGAGNGEAKNTGNSIGGQWGNDYNLLISLFDSAIPTSPNKIDYVAPGSAAKLPIPSPQLSFPNNILDPSPQPSFPSLPPATGTQPGFFPSFPLATGTQLGFSPSNPPATGTQPGFFPSYPPTTGTQPGFFPSNPPATGTQPGFSQTGFFPSNPPATGTQPGFSQTGFFPSNPPATGTQPGFSQTGFFPSNPPATGTQPGFFPSLPPSAGPQPPVHPEGVEEGFIDVLKNVARIGSTVVQAGGPLFGPIGMVVGTAAGGLLGALAGQESTMVALAMGRRGTNSIAPGVSERAVLAEASLQGVLHLMEHGDANHPVINKVVSHMARNYTSFAPNIDALSSRLAPQLTECALDIVSHRLDRARTEPHQEADFEPLPRRALTGLPSAESGFDLGKQGAFAESLLGPTVPLRGGEEGAFDFLGSLLSKGLSLAKPLVSQAANAVVTKVLPQVISHVVGSVSNSEATLSPVSPLNAEAANLIFKRALVADTAASALMSLTREELDSLKIKRSAQESGTEQQEGIVDFIKTAMQKIGPFALDTAQTAIKRFAPVLVDIAANKLKEQIGPSLGSELTPRLKRQPSNLDRYRANGVATESSVDSNVSANAGTPAAPPPVVAAVA